MNEKPSQNDTVILAILKAFEELKSRIEMVNKMSQLISDEDPSIPRVYAKHGANGIDLDCEGEITVVAPYDDSVPEVLIRRAVLAATEKRLGRAELQAHAAFMKGGK